MCDGLRMGMFANQWIESPFKVFLMCACLQFFFFVVVLLPVHNWYCTGNFHICKLPVYLHTCWHKQKKHKKQDIALGERQQDKQHPTSKFQSPFLLCASSSPCLSSYLCLFYSVLVLLLTFIFLSLLLHFQSLPNPSHMLFALCSFPLSVPASFHLSVPLFSTHLFFVAQFSCPVLIGNF